MALNGPGNPEQKVKILWDEGELDGKYASGAPEKPSVLLMHGASNDMDHPLLSGLAQALIEKGWTILRFNFDFVYTHNIDFYRIYRELLAAEAWLRNRHPRKRLMLVGKSLGALMATYRVARETGIEAILALGYPFQQTDGTPIDQHHLRDIQVPFVILQGTHDPYGPPEVVEALLKGLPRPPQVIWIEGADHSFRGQEPRVLAEALKILEVWASTEGRSTSNQAL